MKHKIIGYVFLGVIFAGVVGAIYWWQNVGSVSKQNATDDEFCIQMIQKARNPETGEVKEFSTPCDVPEGWEKINEGV